MKREKKKKLLIFVTPSGAVLRFNGKCRYPNTTYTFLFENSTKRMPATNVIASTHISLTQIISNSTGKNENDVIYSRMRIHSEEEEEEEQTNTTKSAGDKLYGKQGNADEKLKDGDIMRRPAQTEQY